MIYKTITTVANELNVSKPTVYKWIKKGLRTIKIEKLVRITDEDLNKFLQSQGVINE